jgi:hypothetical protein
MRLRYRLNLAELLELNRSSRYQRMKGAIVIAAGTMQLLLAVWMAYYPTEGRDAIIVAIFGTVFVLLGISAPMLAGLGKWALGGAPEIYMDVSDGGIRFADKEGEFLIPWGRFKRVYKTRRLLVLEYHWAADVLAIPRRCCESGKWPCLLEWAESPTTQNHN